MKYVKYILLLLSLWRSDWHGQSIDLITAHKVAAGIWLNLL